MNLRINDMCTRTIAGYKISLYSVVFDLISNTCVSLFSNLSVEAIITCPRKQSLQSPYIMWWPTFNGDVLVYYCEVASVY